MPYIDLETRDRFDEHLEAAAKRLATSGDLNYCITKLCQEYLALRGTNYMQLNAVAGVLECAKHEFFRTTVDPYEEAKSIENGPVQVRAVRRWVEGDRPRGDRGIISGFRAETSS